MAGLLRRAFFFERGTNPYHQVYVKRLDMKRIIQTASVVGRPVAFVRLARDDEPMMSCGDTTQVQALPEVKDICRAQYKEN